MILNPNLFLGLSEEGKGFFIRLSVPIKEKLREEIQQAREERERLQREIQSLLEQQGELNA